MENSFFDNKRNVVKYSQSLATLTTSTPLSLTESRVVFSIIAQIDKDDEDFKEYSLNASKLHDEIKNELRSEIKKQNKTKEQILDISKKQKLTKSETKTKELRLFCDNFLKKTLDVPNEKRDFDLVGWFCNFSYSSDEDKIYCQFHSKLKPYLLDFKNNHFKKGYLENIFTFKCKYSHKFYLLLKTVNTSRYIEIDDFKSIIPLEWLKKWLGLKNLNYDRYNDFKRFVLEKAKKDLDEFAEVSFDFEEIKTKKEITHLKIKAIYKNKNIIDVEIDESATRTDFDDEYKKDTDLENQEIKYFFENGILIRENEKNFRLKEIEEDKLRSGKLTISMTNIDNQALIIKEFSYKSKDKLKKEYILPNHLNYKVWFSENCKDFTTGS